MNFHQLWDNELPLHDFKNVFLFIFSRRRSFRLRQHPDFLYVRSSHWDGEGNPFFLLIPYLFMSRSSRQSIWRKMPPIIARMPLGVLIEFAGPRMSACCGCKIDSGTVKSAINAICNDVYTLFSLRTCQANVRSLEI